jgi:hypothetical protein
MGAEADALTPADVDDGTLMLEYIAALTMPPGVSSE